MYKIAQAGAKILSIGANRGFDKELYQVELNIKNILIVNMEFFYSPIV